VVGVPFTEVAKDLGSVQVKNVVALGALQGVTRLFPKDTFLAAMRTALSGKRAVVDLNEQAFERGAQLSATTLMGNPPAKPAAPATAW
jgi:Pyruvate/2-oxoacid:ferredoxin oxidoreductase gamma subunit